MIRSAFTLIELLVVVTIIVVLLALLTPALSEAVYQAELVQCSGRIHSAGVGVLQYAMDARRSYPHRAGPRDDGGTGLQWGPNLIANRFYDDRPAPFKAAPAALLLDPFSPKINLETKVADNYITAHYQLWFGFVYLQDTERKGMFRVGDRFTFAGQSFNLLMSDTDQIIGDDTTDPASWYESGSHPDRLGRSVKTPAYQDVVNPWPFWNLHGAYATYSSWTTQATNTLRGLIDVNHLYDDGSVRRFADVKRDDERMAFLATHHLAPPTKKAASRFQVPRQ